MATDIELAGEVRRLSGEAVAACNSIRNILTPLGLTPSSRKFNLLLCQLAGLLCLPISHLHGQAMPTGEVRARMGVFATANFANSQLPYFADNALGFDAGAFVQVAPLLGVEARAGAYPVDATFEQMPVTAGLRFAPIRHALFRTVPFAYFGAGFSKSQYSKASYQPSAALWAPCWQSTSGMDMVFQKISWRLYEASWTQTYTLRQNIRTLGLSTGLVYSFGR